MMCSSDDDDPLPGPAASVSSSSSISDDDFALMTDRIILNDALSSFSSSYPYPLFPVFFLPTMSISEYVRSFDDLLLAAAAAKVSLSGMIMNKQTVSKTKFIYELRCLELKAKTEVQVIAEARNTDMDDAEFLRFHSSLQPSAFLGVSGIPGKSENGGLAIFPTSCIVLTTAPKKRLPSNPDWIAYCRPMEHESLQLWQDIMRDKEVKPVYTLRYEIVKSVMTHISKYNFIKEKASLKTIVGGRAAQSFANDCHILGYSSPSLMIWQDKMSCGSAYAYDLGKKINKEGIDLSHFPNLVEFELFMDFDYNDMMQLSERTLSEMVKDLTGGYKIKCHANGLHMDLIEIDFKPPFSKIDIMEELDKLENLEKPEYFSSDATNRYLTGACTKYDIKCPPCETNEELLDKVVNHFLEKCVNPIFILYHPNIVSRREKCGFTRHFKLFVNKHVVFNGYAALEDRFSQIQRISHIKDRLLTEDEEIALEHGLVSTGGWSLGIDRLTLLLTDAKSIEVVGVFPKTMSDNESSSPEHQAIGQEESDSISKFSSSTDDNPLTGPPVSGVDFKLGQSNLKNTLSSLFISSSYLDFLYPLTFIPTMSISDYVKYYSSFDDDLVLPAELSLAGLIMNKLTLSESSTFIYELHCLEFEAKSQVQVIAKSSNSYMDDAEFSRFHCSLKPGVFLGVSGLPGKSENGDRVIFPSSYIVLMREPKKKLPRDPDWDICVESKETVSVQLYRDIMMDKDVGPIFTLCYEIRNYIFSFLKGHNLFQRRTRLNIIGVGKTALSIANNRYASYFNRGPSLESLSCGHEYAYRLGQQIRKIDLSHIPKLTAFEFWVDFNLSDLITLTETMLSEMVKDRIGGYKIKCHANGLNMDPMEIDFNPPFGKINIMEELDKLENLEKPDHFSDDATNKYLSRACSKYNISCSPPQTTDQLLDKLVNHFLEKCVNPTFILYHPNIMSPLGKCGLTWRFKLFINKHEVFNGFAALEDRSTQIQMIWNIKDRLLTEDEEITLEHGLVSTGGWSLGIDRLTLLLTDAKNIEEEVPTSKGAKSRTLLFPCSATGAADGKDVLEASRIGDGLIQSTIQIQQPCDE